MPASQSPCALQPCLQANTGAACRPAWKNWTRWLFLALLCAPIFAAELPDETGKKAEIQLTLLNGDRFDLQQQRGHPVLVMIWASWCPICLGELPQLQQYYQRQQANGLRLIGLSLDDNDTVIREAAQKAGISFPIARRNAPGNYDNLDKTQVTPLFYLIGSDGKVRWRRIGALTHQLH